MTRGEHIQQAIDLVAEHGGLKAASRASGITYSLLQERYAAGVAQGLCEPLGRKNQHGRCRVPDPNQAQGEMFTGNIPDGFKLKGTSTLFDEAGNPRLQWVKTNEDRERQHEMMLELIDELTNGITPVDVIPPPLSVTSPEALGAKVMTVYPVSDHHLGMLAWKHENGEANYDIKIAERLLNGAMRHLVDSAPASERAAILFLGDFMHYDSMTPETPTNRHHLDSDGRPQKMVRAAIRSMRFAIEYAASKHHQIDVVLEIGNHDPFSMIFMMETLANVYADNPRIRIDTSPRHYHYLVFGKNLVATHHGHGRAAKLADLPLIMATDQPEAWGATRYRYFHTGHVHHDQVKDFPGCRVESHRILAPADAYAAREGYRSQRDMKAIVLHHQYGEMARFTVNPRMLEDTAE